MKAIRKNTDSEVPPDFDLAKSIEETVQEMLKEKEENANFFSFNFFDIYSQANMADLIESIFEFSKYLTAFENRVSTLRSEGKSHEAESVIKSGSKKVEEQAVVMARKYGKLLINQRKYQIKENDQTFFETLIYFIIKVLSPAFKKTQLVLIEEELGRMLRSTAFNIPRRRNIEEEKTKMFPQLKNYSKKDADFVIQSIIDRHSIPKHKLRGKSRHQAFRVGYVRMSPFKAMSARSPLLSLILPSPTDKIRAFEESRRKKITKASTSAPPLKKDIVYKAEIKLI